MVVCIRNFIILYIATADNHVYMALAGIDSLLAIRRVIDIILKGILQVENKSLRFLCKTSISY